MRNKMRKFDNGADDFERLESIRLTAAELAAARAQWAQAETIADIVFRAWTASSALVRRVIAAVVRKSVAYADSFAVAAMKASEREREAYLSRAVDVADLERRIRSWQSRGQASRI